MQDSKSVPLHLKLTLSIKEASEYSNIGINKWMPCSSSPTVLSFYMLALKSW